MMAKNWCFTLNNYTADDEALLAAAPVQYMVYGHEVAPSTGTKHLQGFLVLEKNARVSALKKLHPRAHWEQAKGNSQQNRTYCTKEGKDIIERGTPPSDKKKQGEEEKARWEAARASAKLGRFDDIPADIYMRTHAACHKIAAMHQVVPPVLEGELVNEWIYGPAGSGKSTRAAAENPGAYVKGLHKWWSKYTGQDVVILEEMSPFHVHLTSDIKLWAQHQPFSAETKGDVICIRPKKLVVTANYSIDQVWEDQTTREAMHRRFKEIYMDREGNIAPPASASPFAYCDMQCNPKKRKSS